jgi:hypothetical protein
MFRAREDNPKRRLVMSVQNKDRGHDQMLRLPAVSGGRFNKGEESLKEELDLVTYIFRVMDPELYNDYRAARGIKDIGVRHLKTAETAAETVAAGSQS